MPMKSNGAKSLLAGVLAGIAAWTAGCGQSSPCVSEEEKYQIEKPPGYDPIIGYDTTGFPVYGVDEDGNPIYKRPKSK